jgi:hypothetical protein
LAPWSIDLLGFQVPRVSSFLVVKVCERPCLPGNLDTK